MEYNSPKVAGRLSFRLEVHERLGLAVLYSINMIQHAPKPPEPSSFRELLCHDPY